MRTAILGTVCGLLLGCNQNTPTASHPNGTPERPAATTKSTDPTNTGVNVRDRDTATKTPIDQNENKKDVGITADIRKQVVDTKMSVKAQNVKIITQDGKVTLRGPVETSEEKQRIEKIAADVAGAGNVDSQLEVKTP